MRSDPLATLVAISSVLQTDTLALIKEFGEAMRKHLEDSTPPEEVAFLSRALARAFLAHVDGVTTALRDIVLRAHQLGLLDIPAELAARLSAVATESKEEEGESRLSFLDNLDLTFTVFGRLTKLNEPLRKGDFRFAYFKALVTIRNQITHPLGIEDWFQSVRILPVIQLAVAWFSDEITRVLSGGKHTVNRNIRWEKALAQEGRSYLQGIPAPVFQRDATEKFYREVRQDLNNGFRYAWRLSDLLRTDTERWHDFASADLTAPEAQIWRRCYIRSFLTEVEGVCQARCRVVRWAYEDGHILLASQDATLAARERLTLRQKLEVACRLFPLLFGGKSHLDFSGSGWFAFEEILGKRDNFTHPRSVSDLEAPPNLLLTILYARLWFSGQLKI